MDDNQVIEHGGFLYCETSTVTIDTNSLVLNKAFLHGGVLAGLGYCKINAVNSYFGNNYGGYGGVFYKSSNLPITASQNVIVNNGATYLGHIAFTDDKKSPVAVDQTNYIETQHIGPMYVTDARELIFNGPAPNYLLNGGINHLSLIVKDFYNNTLEDSNIGLENVMLSLLNPTTAVIQSATSAEVVNGTVNFEVVFSGKFDMNHTILFNSDPPGVKQNLTFNFQTCGVGEKKISDGAFPFCSTCEESKYH